jgi:hypothetical protein
MRHIRLDRSGRFFCPWTVVSRALTVLVVCALPAIPQSSKAPPALDVEKLMSASEFRQSGLHKLSAEEIGALNAWLSQFAMKVYSAASATADTSSAPSSAAAIETQIQGEFEGWDGETVFKLDNGQIWQQSSYAYTYHYAYRPKVLIYKSGGVYKMKVDGVEDTIQVRRLK